MDFHCEILRPWTPAVQPFIWISPCFAPSGRRQVPDRCRPVRSPTQGVIWNRPADLPLPRRHEKDRRPEDHIPRRVQRIQEAGSHRLRILEFQVPDLLLTERSDFLMPALGFDISAECFGLIPMMLLYLDIVHNLLPGRKGCSDGKDIMTRASAKLRRSSGASAWRDHGASGVSGRYRTARSGMKKEWIAT